MVQFAAQWTVATQNLRSVRFHFPRKSFLSGVLLLVQSSDVTILATGNCFLVLSFRLFLSVLFRFVLLLCSVVLAFQRFFFSLAADLRIFLCLSAAAVSSAELFLVPCLWCHHHHQCSHVFAVQQVVLECVLSSQLMPSSVLQALLSALDLRCWKVQGRKIFHSLEEDGGLLDLSQLERF
jgi:hypothetical protein